MKRVAILLSLLILLPVLSAVEFDMKSEFDQGETLTARVSGNFVDAVLKENVVFYRGHVKIPIISEVAKIDDEFYIYAQLIDKTPENYSVSIEDVNYMQGSGVTDENIVKEFIITNKTADFSVNPGFVISNTNFFIEVQNLQDFKQDIKVKTTTSYGNSGGFFASLFGDVTDSNDISVSVKSGEIKKIDFSIENVNKSSLKTIEVSSDNLVYEVPVYIFVNDTTKTKEKEMDFEPSESNISLSTNSNTTRIFYLKNIGETDLENITLEVSGPLKQYITISEEIIDDLEKDSSVKIEMTISSDSDEKTIEGQLKARATNEPADIYAYSALSLNFIKGYIPKDNETNIVVSSKTCEELNGIICNDNEECDGKTEPAKYSLCCLDNCKKIEKSSTGKIIGWIIIIVIVGFLVWFFKSKYKGARNTVDLFKRLKN